MKYYKFLILFIYIININLHSTQSYASSWPLFTAPSKELLFSLDVIDMQSCPYGQGALKSTVSINIRDHLCSTFCPKSWNWFAVTDNVCHDLASEFEFKGYDIDYYHEDNIVNYTKITAHYGNKDSNNSTFEFIFISDLGAHWYCIPAKIKIDGIICANDI